MCTAPAAPAAAATSQSRQHSPFTTAEEPPAAPHRTLLMRAGNGTLYRCFLPPLEGAAGEEADSGSGDGSIASVGGLLGMLGCPACSVCPPDWVMVHPAMPWGSKYPITSALPVHSMGEPAAGADSAGSAWIAGNTEKAD